MLKLQSTLILICAVLVGTINSTTAENDAASSATALDKHQDKLDSPHIDTHLVDVVSTSEDTGIKHKDLHSLEGRIVITENPEHLKTESRVADTEKSVVQENNNSTKSANLKTEEPTKVETRMLTNQITVDADLLGLGNKKEEDVEEGPVPCTCGVFLSGQFKKGHKAEPKGEPILMQEMDAPFANNAVGNRQCTSKCIETIVKHLPKSNEIVCASVDREHVYRERAYLFIRNYSERWQHTNLSAGREFCCRNNTPYKC
ncbi:unnamed protein product [Callosobruchus maculatus]|uniref:Follicle cell protein 3C-1 n=1 Tax=Callosobruchus maculatus TaxID=64391 RepID=A0A653DWA3_CALMS|nr:unnamed protein product [Callosobruchus maculatus]